MSESLRYLKPVYIDNQSQSLVLFLSGDGATNDFESISKKLNEKNSSRDYLSFVYRGSEGDFSQSLNTIIEDSTTVVQQLFLKYRRVHLVCTSTGAVPTVFLLNDTVWKEKIGTVVLLDPADYYIPTSEDTQLFGNYQWGGAAVYSPTQKTVSDMLLEYKGNAKIHVVGFTLRNTNGTSYYSHESRHLDHKHGFPRMNQEMVRAFYNKTPPQNRGEYLLLNDVPHAYVRDGLVEKNILALTELIARLLED